MIVSRNNSIFRCGKYFKKIEELKTKKIPVIHLNVLDLDLFLHSSFSNSFSLAKEIGTSIVSKRDWNYSITLCRLKLSRSGLRRCRVHAVKVHETLCRIFHPMIHRAVRTLFAKQRVIKLTPNVGAFTKLNCAAFVKETEMIVWRYPSMALPTIKENGYPVNRAGVN